MKPNINPLYVHNQINHPPSIKKNIPLSVENRLSKISSDEKVFSESIPPYQKTLKDSGYDHIKEFNLPLLRQKELVQENLNCSTPHILQMLNQI